MLYVLVKIPLLRQRFREHYSVTKEIPPMSEVTK